MTFAWTGPNGYTSNAANPVLRNVTTAANGTYVLTVTGSGGCATTASVDVSSVRAEPARPVITTNGPVCETGDIELAFAEDYGSATVTYAWVNANGTVIGTGATLTIGATAADAVQPFGLRVTVDGCEAPEAAPVTVQVDAVPTATARNTGDICAGEGTTLLGGAVEGATYAWRIQGSTAVLSTDRIVNVRPAATTTYELVVTRGECASAVATTTVVVSEAAEVTAAASYTLNPDCSASDIALDVTPKAAGNVYAWSGPAGYSSPLASPTITDATSAANGTYTVTVTDANGCVATSAVDVTGVDDPQPKPIVSSTGPACEGATVTLSVPAYTGSDVRYEWTTPGGVTDGVTGANTNVLTVSPVARVHEGDYAVTVVVDDCTLVSEPYAVDVFDEPTAAPAFAIADACEGGAFSLFSNATDAVSFAWTGPNGYASDRRDPVLRDVDAGFNGVYTVTVVSVSGCDATASVTVSGLRDAPEVPTIAAADICRGEDLALATSAAGVKYEWIGPNGASAATLAMPGMTTTTPSTALPQGSGNYLPGEWRVRVTDADGCVATSAPVTVRIEAIATVTAANTGAYCAGEAALLRATAATAGGGDATALTFAWYDVDPAADPGAPVLHFGADYAVGVLPTGAHTYYVTASHGACVSAPAATTVTVYGTPVFADVTGGGTYCEDEDVTLGAGVVLQATGAQDRPQAGATYVWSGPNSYRFAGTTGADGLATAPVDALPSASGTYTLTGASAEGCAIAPVSVVIDVRPVPAAPTLSVDDDSVCEGDDFTLSTAGVNSSSAVTYTWRFDDGDAVTELGRGSQPTYVVRDASADRTGVYSVTVTRDGCEGPASNEVLVKVFGAQTPVATSNTTTEERPACEGDLVRLTAPLISGATYRWFGPRNFASDLPSPVVGPVSVDDAGAYFVAVTVNGCSAVVSDPTEVFVQALPEVPTIVAGPAVCEGGEVTLSVSSRLAPSTAARSFEWYRGRDNELVGTTTEPQLTLADLRRGDSGDYYVVMNLGACRTAASAPAAVRVDYVPDNLADAGNDADYCAVQSIYLDAEVPSVGTGQWTALTGATVSNPDLADSEVIDLREGENLFVWTLSNGACRDYDADTVVVTISSLPVDAAFAGRDVTACGTAVPTRIEALAPVRATGRWTQSPAQASLGVVIDAPDSLATTLSGLEPGGEYAFVWRLTDGTCVDFSRDTVVVRVFDAPEERAFVVGEWVYACGEDDQVLEALEPLDGTGRWTTTGNARIARPRQALTPVEALDPGVNVFVWSLSNGACAAYSTDTLRVVNAAAPTALGGAYVTPYRTPVRLGVLDADPEAPAYRTLVTRYDTAGLPGRLRATDDDGMEFVPAQTFVGVAEFAYTVCDVDCPGRCATASVTVEVGGEDALSAPTIITPDGDGANDAFVVPGLNAYPGSVLSVYNRWGDEVYHSDDYRNDWEGTFKGERLPVGTYFYLLRVANRQAQVIDGYLYLQE